MLFFACLILHSITDRELTDVRCTALWFRNESNVKRCCLQVFCFKKVYEKKYAIEHWKCALIYAIER